MDITDDQCFFITISAWGDMGNVIFPVKFNTKKMDEALKLVQCISDLPEAKLLIAGDFDGSVSYISRAPKESDYDD